MLDQSLNYHASQHNYLASTSDLVLSLLFVFILLLSVMKLHVSKSIEDLNSEDEVAREIVTRLGSLLESSGVIVDLEPNHGVIRLHNNAINFAFGSVYPERHHLPNVGALAKALGQVLPCYVSGPITSGESQDGASNQDREPFCMDESVAPEVTCPEESPPWLIETLLIEGHTDSVPVRPGLPFSDNLELSSIRAANVHRMIASCEPDVERLANREKQQVLSTSGYGSSRPIAKDHPSAPENRRIDLRFLLEPAL